MMKGTLGRASSASVYLRHPTKTLTLLFLAWKAILLPIIACCPGLGYDTSTNLLAISSTASPAIDFDRDSLPWSSPLLSILSPSIWKFVKWDAIYFVRVAERGYLFEQEWAFGWGHTRLLRLLGFAFAQPNGGHLSISTIALGGIVSAHLSHFLSVLTLHALTKSLFGFETQSQKAFCLISAALHVISPAGAFLSAPYGEALFSLLNLTGFYVYSSALHAETAGSRVRRDVSFLLAGVLFAVASTIRGNGIISGCLFAYDAIQGAVQFLHHGLSIDLVRRSGFVVLGGITVALGTIIPQYIAYTEYCGVESPRPWCGNLPPSIFSYVQVYYWNNGFLKYWTVSNLPLFLLAAPVLTTMFYSSFVALTGRLGPSPSNYFNHVSISNLNASQSSIVRLAIAQGLLALLALTTLHVQIINRIASGYPVWYWYLAASALGPSKSLGSRVFATAVQGMAMYALIQAVLFGSFLPPA